MWASGTAVGSPYTSSGCPSRDARTASEKEPGLPAGGGAQATKDAPPVVPADFAQSLHRDPLRPDARDADDEHGCQTVATSQKRPLRDLRPPASPPAFRACSVRETELLGPALEAGTESAGSGGDVAWSGKRTGAGNTSPERRMASRYPTGTSSQRAFAGPLGPVGSAQRSPSPCPELACSLRMTRTSPEVNATAT